MLFEVKEKFKLSDKFIEEFADKQPEWGPLGYITYKRSYSRPLPNGGSEEFWQTLQRVVEGTYTIQLNHCKKFHLPWNPRKAQKSAQEMYRRMWEFKMLPPGRGLWMMGTDYIYERGSMPLNNCAAVSTVNIDTEFAYPFVTLMDMSMMGTGCSFDTKGAGKVKIVAPKVSEDTFLIEDSKEGWTSAVELVLNAYFGRGVLKSLNFSDIRPEGAPIKTFGGIAPGPEPLKRCVEELKHVLDKNIGQPITSTTIVDAMNIIGKCVVSGGVRRCLPQDTLVHTMHGLVKIKEIKVGDWVKTGSGYKRVENVFYQGIQNLITVSTELGSFECTPDHKVKVFVGANAFEFKKARDLTSGDKLVFSKDSSEGSVTHLPAFNYSKPARSTTSVDIKVPRLNENMAWFFGAFHGDGTVGFYKDKKSGKLRGSLCYGTRSDEISTLTKFEEQLKRFGVNTSELKFESENITKLSCRSNQLSGYLSMFKSPNTEIEVPDFVLRGTKQIRAAYLAGVFDSDGSCKTRPLSLCASVYPKFLMSLQAVYASLGIATRIKDRTFNRPKHWKPIFSLNVVGTEHIEKATKLLSEYSCKFQDNRSSTRSIGYHYPGEWFGANHPVREEVVGGNYTPIEVTSVDYFNKFDHTYDIEVSEVHEFVFGPGLISHNSAELALGDPNDEEYLDLKNPNNPELGEYRWASNNSIQATVGMDYAKHAAQTALNGEPGYFWLENAKNYGRMADGFNPKADPYACLTNPCMPAWGKVLTPNGLRTISEIEIGDKIWSSEGWTTVSNKWSTGVKEVWEYTTEAGQLYLTPNHRVVQSGIKVEIQDAQTIDCLNDGISHNILEASYHSTEEVWDITVDNESHTFWYYGFNISNCAEQTLEDGEICCLVETFPSRHDTLEDYMKTCKYAYIYAKTVTLVPTHNPRVNQIINRNRRMGISQSGIIEAFQRHGRRVHFEWCDKTYKYLRDLDADYSCRWLGIPPSIKLTSVKPSGSVSLLPGVTPGIHYAHSEYYWRTIRLDKTSPLVKAVKKAGYRIEESVYGDNTLVVYFPVHEQNFDRAKDEVSIWEQMENVAQMSYYWADNQVSATVTFKPEEADQLPKVLEMYETRLKSISFLPLKDHSYAQAPYQTIDEAEFKKANKLRPLVLGDVHDTDEKFCTNDSCTI